MFQSAELKAHLETSSTVSGESLILAEWNMNVAKNIKKIGNYRYRPNDLFFADSPYLTIAQSFEINDDVNKFYTDATDADVIVDAGVEDDDTPTAFLSKKQKEKLLFSLEDCFGRFRPRSGINKIRYFENRYSHYSFEDMTRRPRYYVAHKDDLFKYWTSYRTEEGQERGIANINVNNTYYITDAAPFVVYENPVPANRVVVKMQTHVGDVNNGPYIADGVSITDPFFGPENKTTPINWKIQKLNRNSHWQDLIVFDANSTRSDGSDIVGTDGYLEIQYGLVVPDTYRNNFNLVKTYSTSDLLPDASDLPNGTAYLVVPNSTALGVVHIVQNGSYTTFPAEYNWSVEEDVAASTNFVTKLSEPDFWVQTANGETFYREIDYLYGLRIVVETMNVFDSTFDLIELSPRLVADISDSVLEMSVTKTASDLGNTGIPVGQLLASVGAVDIFDSEQAFFEQNTNSIVSPYLSQNIQLKFYQIIKEVNGNNYFIPIKTMYSEGFPEISNLDRSVNIQLRDLYFYFESITAPQILLTDVSLSYAIATLLDYIGFSNYIFYRTENEKEEIIPYFFVEPDVTIAQVLSNLATSTQSAMFFDEYNNFVVMSKTYLLPENNERTTDFVLKGSKDFSKQNIVKNSSTSNQLANIIDISFQNNTVYNGGTINYTTRSIQKSYSSIREASLIDRDKFWIYKPALLWEVAPTEATKSINEEAANQSAYALSAIPLAADLPTTVPSVFNNQIINNVMDFGDGIYWLSRYNGYFYANGEIIRYDAAQYTIPGLSDVDRKDPNVIDDNVWINNVEEYQKYFAKISFGGKMYPTGLVRIYAEPNYEVINGQTRMKNGPVARHGRGQFGTPIVSHPAGISSSWTSSNNLFGCVMESKYIFNAEISRLNYTNMLLISNTDNAVLQVSDSSLARVGDYVEKLGDSENNRIPADTTITAIDSENNRITLSSTLTSISDDDFVALGQVNNAIIESNDPVAVINVGDLSNIEVGQYVKLQDESVTQNKIPDNTTITAKNESNNTITLSNALEDPSSEEINTINIQIGYISIAQLRLFEKAPAAVDGKAGVETSVSQNTSREGVIKNIFSSTYTEEKGAKLEYYPATMQASALVLKGDTSSTTDTATDYLSCVSKSFENESFKHFGTRMRIIGKIENNDSRGQTPEGSSVYYSLNNTTTGQSPSISGSSGGIAVMYNPTTNNGYYFEIVAITENNPSEYSASTDLYNVFFYRVDRSAEATEDDTKAIPTRLFGGIANILVDEGSFVGQSRMTAEANPTVYDLAVEYEDIGTTRRFYLYINNQVIGIADDPNPLPVYNNIALFVRGESKCMFENVYALSNNYSQNTTFALEAPANSVFNAENINAQESFRKYAMSGIIQSTYLQGIGTAEPPKYNLYYEEFGTIMREASYFDIRYDKAYPALYAQISPTFSKVKTYTISGFLASSYGAEFLIFNHTDSAIALDSGSGNYLRIQGVTFTQQSTHELTVDEYYRRKSDFSDPNFVATGVLESPVEAKKNYNDIKLSRITEGQKEFVISAPYVQTQDSAERMMKWLVDKTIRSRKSVGVDLFPIPTLQLGDIVTIDYVGQNGFSELSDPTTKFVVYSIDYKATAAGPTMKAFLSEV